MTVYYLSGLGSNQKAYERLDLNTSFEYKFLPYLRPKKVETLNSYAKRMAEPIDTSKPFILMGLSFGGILAQEINNFKPAYKLILISTVKSREELPLLIRSGKYLKIGNWLPTQFFTTKKGFSYTFFRDKILKGAPSLDEFFTERDPHYLRWSMAQVSKWQGTQTLKDYTHIHGDKDLVFPFGRIKNAIRIKGGTHLMILQKPKMVSRVLNELLSKHLLENS